MPQIFGEFTERLSICLRFVCLFVLANFVYIFKE